MAGTSIPLFGINLIFFMFLEHLDGQSFVVVGGRVVGVNFSQDLRPQSQRIGVVWVARLFFFLNVYGVIQRRLGLGIFLQAELVSC